MWLAECRQESYNKSEHRRHLQTKLNKRSDRSIDSKHQNISAVLIRAGHTYIKGYKPLWHFQLLLEEVVLDRLKGLAQIIEEAEDVLIHHIPESPKLLRLESIFVPPPERDSGRKVHDKREFKPRLVDFAGREARNKRLGTCGEQFVLEVERNRLTTLGREDLAADVEWTSAEKGDGAGYDIRSFSGKTDEPLFIEVKTTSSGKYQPFLISANEVAFSDKHAEQYSLYRVFDFVKQPAVFRLDGHVSKHVDLAPTLFRASY